MDKNSEYSRLKDMVWPTCRIFQDEVSVSKISSRTSRIDIWNTNPLYLMISETFFGGQTAKSDYNNIYIRNKGEYFPGNVKRQLSKPGDSFLCCKPFLPTPILLHPADSDVSIQCIQADILLFVQESFSEFSKQPAKSSSTQLQAFCTTSTLPSKPVPAQDSSTITIVQQHQEPLTGRKPASWACQVCNGTK
jgi:hypothetical protein